MTKQLCIQIIPGWNVSVGSRLTELERQINEATLELKEIEHVTVIDVDVKSIGGEDNSCIGIIKYTIDDEEEYNPAL